MSAHPVSPVEASSARETSKGFRSPWAFVALLSVLALILLQVRLLRSPEAMWTGGTGVLRGTRRGFALFSEAGAVASWDSLGLFVAVVAALLTAAVGSSARATLALAGLVALATLNDSRLLAVAWSVVAFSCTIVVDHTRRVRWSAGVASVVAAGVGLSVLVVREVPGVLHAPAGYGGALDGAGIGMIRHILTGSFAGHPVELIAAPAVLVVVAAGCVAAGAMDKVAAISVAAGPVLLLKLYPLIELAAREGSTTYAALVVPGAILVAWAGLRHPPRPFREGLVASGGAMVLLGTRLPLEAVIWAATWAAVSAERSRAFLGPQTLGLVASCLVLVGFAAANTQPLASVLCSVMAAGLVLAGDRPIRGERWLTGLAVCGVLTALLIPPISAQFWRVWTGKLRPTLPGSLAPWLTVAGGCAVGVGLCTVGHRWRLSSRDRLARVQARTASWAYRWISPGVDTMAVVWVAVERFGWQGISLWLPRRALVAYAIGVSWFQTVVVPVLSRLPFHLLVPIRWGIARFTESPRWFVLAMAVLLAVAWLI